MPARLPRRTPARLNAALLAACVVLAGCNLGGAGTAPAGPAGAAVKRSPGPKASGAAPGDPQASAAPIPVVGPVDAAVVHLTGKVKLIANNGGGIISDHGAGIISNNTGGLIADAGGSLVSNNSAGVVSNNGAQYALRAAAPEALLADAQVRFEDAAGQPLRAPDGQPLIVTTDRQGRYALRATLGAGALVMRVKLWNGGELAALLVHDGQAGGAQDVDTASSLGAAFVLDRYVKGDQAILNKLPAAEAQRLQRDMEAARERLAEAPTYTPAALAAAADDLRGQDPTVAKTLQAIEALLIGQAKLGDGRPATQVPLNRPTALGFDAQGRLTIAEYGMGRVRVVDDQGLMSTLVDANRGAIKTNFPRLQDQILAPDGTAYFATIANGAVYRVKAGGSPSLVYEEPAPSRWRAFALALGPDGTLYMGGGDEQGGGPWKPRLIAVAPDGTKRELPPLDAAPGLIRGLAVAADGTMWVLRSGPHGAPAPGTLHKVPPGGAPQLLASDLRVHSRSDLALAPDGKVYVCDDAGGRVLAFAADGARSELAGPGAAAPIQTPSGLAVAKDGRIFVSDQGSGQVRVRRPDGAWNLVAGVDGDAAASDGRSLPLNTPIAIAFDAQGRLIIAENGRHRLVRFADGRLETIAGTTEGFGGDGGPAKAAGFDGITGLAAHGDALLVMDSSNNRLRRIGPDGVVTTIAGAGEVGGKLVLEGSVARTEVNLKLGMGMTVDAAGRAYWANAGRHQVQRLGEPTRVDLVAGKKLGAGDKGFAAILADVLTDGEAAPTSVLRFPLGLAFKGEDLYVADAGHGQIRKVTGLAGADPRIETVAGAPTSAFAQLLSDPSVAGRDGKAREVWLASPAGLCFDAAGNMYVGELGTAQSDLMSDIFPDGAALDLSALPPVPARIRKITPDGVVTTIAGPNGRHFADPTADDALVMPLALAIRPDGALVIADPGANLVRILPAGTF